MTRSRARDIRLCLFTSLRELGVGLKEGEFAGLRLLQGKVLMVVLLLELNRPVELDFGRSSRYSRPPPCHFANSKIPPSSGYRTLLTSISRNVTLGASVK